MMLHAVIFDFDGVIADSEPLHLRAYQAVLRTAGIDLGREDYYARYLGYDDLGLFQALAKDRGIQVGADTLDTWMASKSLVVEQMLLRDSILYPEAAACIRMFAEHVPLAIASGALEPEIAMVLDRAGLRECFTAIASASDGVRGKPAPDLYLLAIAKLGSLDPSSCVAIEDSHWGLEAAREAGLRSVAVTHTYPAAELGSADLIIDRLSDLTVSKVEELMRDNSQR